MIAALAAFLSGIAFFASADLGAVWPFAWAAATPVLWFAFRTKSPWRIAGVAFAARAIGGLNLVPVYYTIQPPLILAGAIAAPALLFTLSVLAAHFVRRRVSGLAALLAFAAFWTGFDYLASFGPHGVSLPIAYSQIGAPWLSQTAALFGMWSITFLIALVSAAAALAIAERKAWPALFAAMLFLGNAAYGLVRVRDHGGPSMRVALIDSDALDDAARADDRFAALNAIDSYAGQIETLAERKPDLFVLPEALAVLKPGWRMEAENKLVRAAHETSTTVIAGFTQSNGKARHSIALVFTPGHMHPLVYAKHHPAPDRKETAIAGPNAPMTANRVGVEIGQDMDFSRMIRADAKAHPRLVAVPAWDFGDDGYGRARVAIMRSIENGFALARTARDGVLSISDSYGRVVARRSSADDASVTLVKSVSLGWGGGFTLYSRIGDLFAWLSLALALFLIAWALAQRRNENG